MNDHLEQLNKCHTRDELALFWNILMGFRKAEEKQWVEIWEAFRQRALALGLEWKQ